MQIATVSSLSHNLHEKIKKVIKMKVLKKNYGYKSKTKLLKKESWTKLTQNRVINQSIEPGI